MARCPPELLADVADVLTVVRQWVGLIEKKPGVLYIRREPFLHFHLLKGARRRADIKGSDGWRSMELPQPLPSATRRQFLHELKGRYREKSRLATQ